MYGNSQSQGVGSASAPYRPNTQAYNQYSPPAQYQTAFASANESPAAQNYPQAGGTQNYSQPGADHSYSAPGGFPVHQQAGGSQVNYSAPQQMTYQSSAYPSNPGMSMCADLLFKLPLPEIPGLQFPRTERVNCQPFSKAFYIKIKPLGEAISCLLQGLPLLTTLGACR